MKCNIIATGNSLRGYDLSQIKGFNIAVNYAYNFLPCDMTVFYDNVFQRFKDAPNPQYLKIFGGQWNHGGGTLNMNKGCVCGYPLSVIMALNIAMHEGFTEINFYGVDNYLGDFIHFYDEEKPTQEDKSHYERQFRMMQEQMDRVKPQLKNYTLNFYGSRLEGFNNYDLK